MSIKDIHTQLTSALLIVLLLFDTRTTIAVVNPGQYSRFPTQSFYSQSLSSYGNEHQNYFDNAGELTSTSGYSNEPYKDQQYPPTGYTSSGGAFDDGGDEQPSYYTHRPEDSHQLHPTLQDNINELYSAFGQDQDTIRDNFDRLYSVGAAPSSQVSFDNIDFNNSETTRYQPTKDIIYPPLDSRTNQRRQQHQTPARQHYALPADYMTANNKVSPLIPSRINSLPSSAYLHEDRTPKDSMLASNVATAAVAQMTVTTGRLPPSPLARANQLNARYQMDAGPYTENENQQQHQRDQYHIPRTSEKHHRFQFEPENSRNNERVSNSSSSRTYYVADSDLSASTSNQLDTESLSVLQIHLVQLPAVSLPSHGSASLPNYGIPSEPIPISKHVEITKHIPIPVFRQVRYPYRKPVRIEIPRTVINTVPRPYPIQIPTVMKPVAVPMVKEVKIPIEKVTPYPVEHKVPYVVEKRVPFQIEKQVASPVYYPFPVRVPMVRTIVHKKKSHLPLLQYRPRIHM